MEPEKEPNRKENKDEQEITLKLPNFSRLGFLKNLKKAANPKLFIFLLLILIPIIITVGVRLQPIELKMTEDWASNTVNTNLRSQIQASIEQQNPTLSADRKQALFDEQYSQVLRDQAGQIESQIKEISDYYKTAFQYSENGNTYTYLGDLDSYFYLRQARNIIENGDVCDEIIEGKCIDNHMIAPIGSQMERTLHPYAIVYTYKILHAFDSKINLMYASFYLPTIIAVLVSILAFLVARRIAGNAGGFFAAVFISTSTIFLTRTMGSDTDIWNIFFPILVLYLFIMAIEAKKQVQKLVFAGLLGLAFGAYSFAWSAWWFSFDLLLLTYGLFLLYSLLQDLIEHKTSFRKIIENKKLRSDTLTFLVIIFSSGVFVSLISSFGAFTSAPFQPFAMNTIDSAAKIDLWPNVYTTVAELNNSNLSEVVSTLGGRLFFFLILMGIILAMMGNRFNSRELTYVLVAAGFYFLLVQDAALSMGIIAYLLLMCIPIMVALFMVFKDRDVEIKYSMLLLLWSLASLYAAMKGVRFVLLLIPIAGVALGVALGKLHNLISSVLHRQLNLNRLAASLILFIIFSLMFINPVKGAYSVGRNFLPSISSTWADSLEGIGESSSEEAIINSWWDFGHWFKYFADRKVTFDGASQNVPQAHWIGKALLTDDEDVSIGIIRMLDCGANKAYETLYPLMDKDSVRTIGLINQIIVLDKDDARKILEEQISDKTKVEEVLELTHCEPPENYFITSDDMVGKSGVWAHFGSWDFKRAYLSNNIQGKTRSEALSIIKSLGYTENESEALYSEYQALKSQNEINAWIAPWPGYLSDSGSCRASAESEKTIECAYNLLLSQNQQYNVVLESATINLAEPGSSYATISYLSRQDNTRLQSESIAANGFVIAEETTLKRYVPNSGLNTIGLDIIVDTTSMRSIVSDPALSMSLFTKLYFLDGRYTTHFQKFSDMRNQVIGHHIIVWKLDWGNKQ